MTLYKFLYACFAWVFKLVYRVHPHNTENIPENGACIIAPNHTAALDCIIVAVSSPRQAMFMAKAELFKIPVLSWLIRALGAFPVKRAESDVTAIKTAISILKDEKALCMFPQGTRCPRAELEDTKDKLKWGVGLISEKSGAVIVPVYIKTKYNKLKLFGRTDVYYGKPVSPSEFEGLKGREKYAQVASFVFDRICEIKNNIVSEVENGK